MVRRERTRTSKSALHIALEAALEGEPSKRLFAIEAIVRPTYEAFPKNSKGQLPPSEIFPALVRGYFAREHGWRLVGLEAPGQGPGPAWVDGARVLQEAAPSVAAALREGREADRGLSLSDVVRTIAVVEHLVLDQSALLLRGAYELHGRSAAEALNPDALEELLRSYLLLFRQGSPHNLTDVEGHRRVRARAEQSEDWPALAAFAHGALPAGHGPHGFEAAARAARDLALGFGRWQESECRQMKQVLVGLGQAGAVPLGAFHAEPPHASFRFTESADYLRRTGALEEAEGREPRVLVANYLLGPSNCIASSELYSVCCLSECLPIQAELELAAQAPAWAPERLLAAASDAGPEPVPETLGAELQALAERHGGVVPLHSAGLAAWLHRAFPNECPLPTAPEAAAEESERLHAEEWLELQRECTRLPPWHPAAEVTLEV